MKRLMVPVGQFVAAIPPKNDKSGDGGEYFTVTAYDPVMGQYIAMGHSSATKLVGYSLYRANGKIPETGDETVDLEYNEADIIGIATRQESLGVSGPFFADASDAIQTAKPKEGTALLVSSLIPGGHVEVNITSASGESEFTFTCGFRIVKGMSGTPIVQNGHIVGVLWSVSGKKNLARSIEYVADKLLDAWAYKAPVTRPVLDRATIEKRREIARKRAKKIAEIKAAKVEVSKNE